MGIIFTISGISSCWSEQSELESTLVAVFTVKSSSFRYVLDV
jgi:hypothetical protein